MKSLSGGTVDTESSKGSDKASLLRRGEHI